MKKFAVLASALVLAGCGGVGQRMIQEIGSDRELVEGALNGVGIQPDGVVLPYSASNRDPDAIAAEYCARSNQKARLVPWEAVDPDGIVQYECVGPHGTGFGFAARSG